MRPVKTICQFICVVFVTTVLIADAYAGVPSSRRSREAAAAVKPRLETSFNKKGLAFGSPVFLRIFKATKELEVWIKKQDQFELYKTYEICTYGSGSLGPKTMLGDGQAPEGFYFVTPDRMNPYSSFHLAFNLGYPNAYDRALGRTGSALMVHGDCVSIGCFAMTDAGIEEIYAIAEAALTSGQPFFRVHVFPFRMTAENMNTYRTPQWTGFWENLRQGYDWFETHRVPPDVRVRNGKYVFDS